MKALFFKFLIVFITLTQNFLICENLPTKVSSSIQNQKTEKISKIDVDKEIENCIFLEKQFLPQKPNPTFFKKTLNISIQAGVSIASGLFLIKILNSRFFPKQKAQNRQKISMLVFLISMPIIFFLLKYLTKPKETTTFEQLKNFIKLWPSQKNNISEKFWEKFENIHSLYQKNKNLPLSEDEAEKFVKKILMEAIDYKIYLQYKQCNF